MSHGRPTSRCNGPGLALLRSRPLSVALKRYPQSFLSDRRFLTQLATSRGAVMADVPQAFLESVVGPGERSGITHTERLSRHGAPRRALPPRPRQALLAHRPARAGAGPSDHRDDDVPRNGDDILAREGGGGDK